MTLTEAFFENKSFRKALKQDLDEALDRIDRKTGEFLYQSIGEKLGLVKNKYSKMLNDGLTAEKTVERDLAREKAEAEEREI